MGGGVIGAATEFEGFRREMGARSLGDWMESGVQAGGVCSSKKTAEVSEMEGVCVRNTGGQQQKRNLEVGGTVRKDRCVWQDGELLWVEGKQADVYGVVGEV